MDLFSAQRLLALDGRFSQIDVAREEGADAAVLEAKIAKIVSGRGLVERPRMRAEALERLLAAHRYSSTVFGAIVMALGLYLILNTMMIAVAQRRGEIGTLRAAGMRRGDVLRLIVLEALLLGGAGAMLGLPSTAFRRSRRINEGMGLTVLRLDVANPARPAVRETVDFLVDSGAIYSVVPASLLRRLRIRPAVKEEFRLADGSTIVRRKGGAMFYYGRRVGFADVIFGEPGDHTLLGALTLEALGLSLDPLRRELRPLPMVLAPIFAPRSLSGKTRRRSH